MAGFKAILGLGSPFATRWGLALLIGPFVFVAYRAMKGLVVGLFDPSTVIAYPILVHYGPASVFLGAMFLMHQRYCFPDIRFVGAFDRKSVVNGIVAISVVYLVANGTAYLLGQPREPSMVRLYWSKTDTQIAVFIVSLLVLPPIVEELAFRHFILSVFPFNANVWISRVAVTATAVFFVRAHGYEYLTSDLAIFAVGVIFGVARIRSGGLLLPIGLHGYAIGFGLLCDWIAAHLQS